MPGQPAPNIVQIGLRGTKDLRRRLIAASKASGRSLNAEIVARLERSFSRERPDEILDEAKKWYAGAERYFHEAESIMSNYLNQLEKRYQK